GEVVTLVFTPSGSAPDLVAVDSANIQGPDSNNPNFPTYRITINEDPPLGHPCEIECSFPAGNGSVILQVSGSHGGTFQGPTFTPTFPTRGLDLRVEASNKGGVK